MIILIILMLMGIDYNLMLQAEYMPNFADEYLNIENNAVSISSSRLSCRGENLQEFLNKTEKEIYDRLYSMQFVEKNTTDYLLFNCEGDEIPKNWGTYNNDTETQNKIFNAMVKRMRVARVIFPNATISLGASIRPHKQGLYLPFMIERIEGYRRAGEHGVFDYVDCLEPRIFIDRNDFNETNITASINQAMNVSNNVIKTSVGGDLDSCVTIGINHFFREEVLSIDIMNGIILQLSSYESVRKVNFWAGDFRRWYIPYLNDITYQ